MSATTNPNRQSPNRPSQRQPHQSPSAAVEGLASDAAESLAEACRDCSRYYFAEPLRDLSSLAKDYAKQKPEVACVWAFTFGVLLGWKAKPW